MGVIFYKNSHKLDLIHYKGNSPKVILSMFSEDFYFDTCLNSIEDYETIFTFLKKKGVTHICDHEMAHEEPNFDEEDTTPISNWIEIIKSRLPR